MTYNIMLLDSVKNVLINWRAGDYPYERQPPANFTHCNPVRTSLKLTCIVQITSDSTTVIIDWYWSKNISECVRNIRNFTQRFVINTSRGYHSTTKDLIIMSPERDTLITGVKVMIPLIKEYLYLVINH